MYPYMQLLGVLAESCVVLFDEIPAYFIFWDA